MATMCILPSNSLGVWVHLLVWSKMAEKVPHYWKYNLQEAEWSLSTELAQSWEAKERGGDEWGGGRVPYCMAVCSELNHSFQEDVGGS